MQTVSPLKSHADYSRYLAKLLDRPTVKHSNLIAWSDSPYTGMAEGEVLFSNGMRLRVREELDFDAALITSYGYEVYQGQEKLYWYDDFPHPNDPILAKTFPHHKHIPPDIKRNRIPAPEMSFDHPNIQILIQQIEQAN